MNKTELLDMGFCIGVPLSDPLEDEFVPALTKTNSEDDVLAWLSNGEINQPSESSAPSCSTTEGHLSSQASSEVTSEASSEIQKCSTCHATKELGQFPARAGKVGKTCHKCINKKKRKAADTELQGKKHTSGVLHELQQVETVVRALIYHNAQLVKSNDELRGGTDVAEHEDLQDVTSALDNVFVDPLPLVDTPQGVTEASGPFPWPTQVDTPQGVTEAPVPAAPAPNVVLQKCSTCHRQQQREHFNGFKTCPSCRTKKRRMFALQTEESQLGERQAREKLSAIRAQLQPLLDQNAKLIITNNMLKDQQLDEIMIDELNSIPTGSIYNAGNSSTSISASGSGAGGLCQVSFEQTRWMTAALGILILLSCIGKFFVMSSQLKESMHPEKDHRVLEIILMIVNVSGWLTFGSLLYMAWGRLPAQRIYFMRHNQKTLLGLLLFDILMFIVLSVPWWLDPMVHGKCKGPKAHFGKALMAGRVESHKGFEIIDGFVYNSTDHIVYDIKNGIITESLLKEWGYDKKKWKQQRVCDIRGFEETTEIIYGWISSVCVMLAAAAWSIILQYVSNVELRQTAKETSLVSHPEDDSV